VGACMRVHNELGSRLLEKYYQRAVAEELKSSKLSFVREAPVRLVYKGKSIGRYFVDFVIEGQIILELKAQKDNQSKFYRQVLAYLRQLDLPLGLVVNFRQTSIKPGRIVNSKWPGFQNSNKLEVNLNN